MAESAPVDELCFGDRKFDVQGAPFPGQDPENLLEVSNNPMLGVTYAVTYSSRLDLS